MKRSHRPVASGFHVRLMSPLGIYPVDSIILADAGFVASPELCFSMVSIVKEDWGFSEVDSLAPLDIPLFGGLILPGAGYPYPFSGLTLESDTHKALTPECIAECRQHLLAALEEQRAHEGPAAIVHRPPILGGKAYDLRDYGGLTEKVRGCITLLGTASPVALRGVASLIKAQMACRHGEFADAACIYLWIALDAAHSLTLQKLRDSGVQNPTSKDASDHFDKVAGFKTPWEKFFEEDYENRIRAIHPDNRFGPEARPQFLADDFYELNELLIPHFFYLVTGEFIKLDFMDE
jgi:hypothetical protein